MITLARKPRMDMEKACHNMKYVFAVKRYKIYLQWTYCCCFDLRHVGINNEKKS